MTQANTGSASLDSDEVELRALLLAVWRRRWLIIAVTSLFAVASLALALMLPTEYRATAILTPASTSSASALSRLAGQFGGLASLAGIGLGGTEDQDKSVLAVELLKTWSFQETFIRDNQIEVEVFAATAWDRSTGRLRIDADLYDTRDGKWVRDFDPAEGRTAEPSGWELYDAFRNRVSVSQDATTGLISLGVEYYSPRLAKEWVDKLVVAVNKHLQEQDRQEARRSIEYLNQQIDKTSLTEMRTVLYTLVEEQTKNLMLAEVSDEYVLRTLSPANVPEQKSGPPRALICMAGTLLGVFAGVIFALTLNVLRREVPRRSTS